MDAEADPYWIEVGSSATLDGEALEASRQDPRPVFYPDEDDGPGS